MTASLGREEPVERKVEGRSVREIWSRRAGWAVCDARIAPRGTAVRVGRTLPSRHPGASTDPLRREDPAERERGLYDLNVDSRGTLDETAGPGVYSE